MKLEQSLKVFAGKMASITEEDVSPLDILRQISKQENQEDAFYVFDVADLVQKVKHWRLLLPRVKPFFAVKCNTDPTVLKVLSLLGTGFDCASKSELKQILDLDVQPEDIIFANPCKPVSHVRFASSRNVPLMTFDNEAELYKIKAVYPSAKLVLRIRVDAEAAQCPLGMKFGALLEDSFTLLSISKKAELDIVGVSFHVGSGCQEPQVFARAIAAAKVVFGEAEQLGFKPYILDLGGGYPGHKGQSLDEIAGVINPALDEHFPVGCGVRIIAEPGRYMVASAFTLATLVTAKRDTHNDEGEPSTMYYINDGVYSSFSCVLYDHQAVIPQVLRRQIAVSSSDLSEHCSVWGATCDGLDQVCTDAQLPRLQLGDWLYWENMGAYTFASAGSFNGFPVAKVHLVVPRHTWLYLEHQLGVRYDLSNMKTTAAINCNAEAHGEVDINCTCAVPGINQ